jgi:multiple sugar transport system ATP-binding protein
MRAEIARIQRDLGVTTIYVTHDQTEAMTMGDRVGVHAERLPQQVAARKELYDGPRNLFVAEFIGSPAMNLVLAELERGTATLGRVRRAPAAPRAPTLEHHRGLADYEAEGRRRDPARGHRGRAVLAESHPERD